jgi:AcrR family transcriptional regulator
MKSEKLKKQIFHSAMQIVEEEGMTQLSARKVAEKSCCALGSIYNVFGDLDDLQLHVNAAILSRLYDVLHKTIEEGIKVGKSLKSLFMDLGFSYIKFGQNHTTLWKALFEYLPSESLPEWYSIRARDGIYRLAIRLATTYGLEENEVKKLIGFFWSSIHGISAILLNRKMEMVAELFQRDCLHKYVEFSLHGLFQPGHEELLPQQ